MGKIYFDKEKGILCIDNSEIGFQDGQFSILHFSDLHFGENHRNYQEVNAVGSLNLAQLIVNTLTQLKPQAVVISGDISTKNDKNSYDEALNFLNTLKQKLKLHPSQFIIVPGNHDIDRGKKNDKMANFLRMVSKFYGLNGEVELKKTGFSILNCFNGITFFGFDSTIVNQDVPEWGYISREQRIKFNFFLGPGNNCLKIAVCHHHLLPIAKELIQNIDDNDNCKVSLLYDAAPFIEWLIRHDFSVCLHGHQHLPYMLTELRNDLNPRNPDRITFNHQALTIIAAGCSSCMLTNDAESLQNFWNFLTINREQGKIDLTVFTDDFIQARFTKSSNTTVPITSEGYLHYYIGGLFERIGKSLENKNELNKILSESLYAGAVKEILVALGVLKRDGNNVVCVSEHSNIIEIHKNLLQILSVYIKGKIGDTKLLDYNTGFPATQQKSFYSPLLLTAHLVNKLSKSRYPENAREACYVLFPIIAIRKNGLTILLRKHINWGNTFLVPAVKKTEMRNLDKLKERLEINYFNYSRQIKCEIPYKRNKVYTSPSRGKLTKYNFTISLCQFDEADFDAWSTIQNMRWFTLEQLKNIEHLAKITGDQVKEMHHYLYCGSNAIFPNNLDVIYEIVKFLTSGGKSLKIIWDYESRKLVAYKDLESTYQFQIDEFIVFYTKRIQRQLSPN